MDVHLNIPPTQDNSGQMAAIETLTARLLSWTQGIQELDNSFKLHTVDPGHQSQKVLHDLDNFPTSNMNEVKEFFKGAQPISDGGKVFLKIKASFKKSAEELLGNAQWYHSEKRSYSKNPQSKPVTLISSVGCCTLQEVPIRTNYKKYYRKKWMQTYL